MVSTLLMAITLATADAPQAGTKASAIPLVCIGSITSEGLEEQQLAALNRQLRADLARMDALAPPNSGADPAREPGQCADSAGGRAETTVGMLVGSAVRFGPIVSVNLQFLDAANGASLFESKLTLTVRDFPSSPQLASALEQGVGELRKQPRARAAGAKPDAVAGLPPSAAPPPVKTVEAIAPDQAFRPAQSPPTAPPPAPESAGVPLALIGWIAGGVGATLLIVGAASGIGAAITGYQLGRDKLCNQKSMVCAFEKQGEINAYDALRNTFPIPLIAGGVTTAGAVALLLLASGETTESDAAISSATPR
jgi:hypothetical protein